MQQPHVGDSFAALPDTHVIPTYWPVPGLGTMTMNAFVVRAAEPVLVDTGAGVLADDFVDALADIVDPTSLRWIWLTHEDRDHTGALTRLLEIAPQATVLGTFLTFGRFSPDGPLPAERTRIVNAGDRVDVGDRVLHAVRPPLYDSPGTLGFVDSATGAYFSSDAFGAPLPADEVTARHTDGIDPTELRAAQIAWATTDSPWVTSADADALAAAVHAVRMAHPSVLLSTHLPPVRRRIADSLGSILEARTSEPTPGPTQQQIEELLATFDPTTERQSA